VYLTVYLRPSAAHFRAPVGMGEPCCSPAAVRVL
jgi:hypothetical protein